MKQAGNCRWFGFCTLFFFIMLLHGGCTGQKVLLKKNDSTGMVKGAEKQKAGDRYDGDYSPVFRPSEDPEQQIRYRKKAKEPAPFHSKNIHVPAHTEKPGPPMASQVSGDKNAPHVISKKSEKDRGSSQAGNIVLNFDNADLYEVIRNLAELLNINYIADPNVRGTVTIHTAGQLQKKDLFPVFFQILEANGLTAVKEGSLYKIVSLRDAPRMPIASRFGQLGKEAPPGERIIIQIIPLKFISGQEITKLLTPFISAEGSIVTHEDSNTLLLVDKAANILKALKLIRVFDVNVFEKVSHRVYHFEYADAEEMAKTLTDIIASYGAAKDTVKFIAVQRLNTLIVVSSVPYVFDKIQQIIRQFDVPGDDIEPRIYVYSVKNGEANDLAELLNSVFSRASKKERVKQVQPPKESKKTDVAKLTFGSAKSEKTKKTGGNVSAAHSSGTLKGDIRITSDEVRNALIIEAIPRDYQIIGNILKRIDVLPRQVLIEVTIAEISLDTKTDLGIEWSYVKGSRKPDTSTLEARIGVAGLRYLLGQTDRWFAALSALATDKKINILSSPSILASDNKEAKIDISTEVPVASAIYNKDDSNIVETNIQYRDTGVILSVTPHINEYGLVSMDISQEVSNQLEDSVQVGTGTQPAFFKRSISTSLTVKHGQTIVIGGLIQQTENRGFSGLPCLSSIPVAQYLFGKKSESIDKKELILLITPRVITTLEDVDAVTEEFKSKVGNAIK
ncbi:MAG: hypothetical protein DRI57_05555 [Deltaproteobacteria bacterium]|nr:MAG: hypothetical protein DRI57_05555 [Deltaproteobacteria bacterium]